MIWILHNMGRSVLEIFIHHQDCPIIRKIHVDHIWDMQSCPWCTTEHFVFILPHFWPHVRAHKFKFPIKIMVSTAQQMQRRKLAVRKRKRDAYNLKKKQAHYISMEGSKDEGTHDISAMISESVKKHRYDSDNKRTYYVQATKKAKSNSHDELTSEDSCATSKSMRKLTRKLFHQLQYHRLCGKCKDLRSKHHCSLSLRQNRWSPFSPGTSLCCLWQVHHWRWEGVQNLCRIPSRTQE